MRVIMAALAICFVAVAARAQQDTDWDMGGQVRFSNPSPEPPAPRGVRKEAEDAVTAGLKDPSAAEFREVGTQVVTSVRQGPFADPVPGPVSIVCGQYALRRADGGKPSYAWFFVPIKHSQILWRTVDPPSNAQGDAYLSCKNAGLAN